MVGKTKYQSRFCPMLVDHMTKGYSFESFANRLAAITEEEGKAVRVTSRTLYKWVREFPEFEEAKETGWDAGLRFYEMILRAKATGIQSDNLKKMIGDNDVSISALIFVCKTRFYKVYGDQLKIQGIKGGDPIKIEADIPFSVEEAKELLAIKMAKNAKEKS